MLNGLKLVVLAAIAASPFAAAAQPISLRDSFPLGSGGGTLCTAQLLGPNAALTGMFDRGYAIVCRDAAVPVGQVYALRTRDDDPAARLAALRADKARCTGRENRTVDDLGAVEVDTCTMADMDVGYRVYSMRRGDRLYVAEGLAGYDSALRLGLRTVVADAPVPGEISIAVTEAGDAASFARVQAGSLDRSRALAEAYRRNNQGNYAEAAEFFASLTASEGASAEAEALANQALQQSNLGNHVEANLLFARAAPMAAGDPVLARMLRNYRAMHLLNQNQPRQALAELDRPLPGVAAAASDGRMRELVIDGTTAARLNSETDVARQLGAAGGGLLPEDKVQILDGQADHLRGTIHRLQGRPDQAATALTAALDRLGGVRGGRVSSTVWMRGQLLGELAAIAEDRADRAEAERQHQAAIALLSAYYPGSASLLNAEARFAAYYARTGQAEPALALYRRIVDANIESGSSSPTLRRTLAPYFQLLAAQADRSEAVADMFKASQMLVRPGVAQTQAILARELSGGSDEASRLFRQSVDLTRDIERSRVEAARIGAMAEPTPADVARAEAARARLAELERAQVATQAKLAEFPRYRVVSGGAIALADLQQVLREGEAYYKMTIVGDDAYAIFATPAAARAFKIAATSDTLEREVDALRDTIVTIENGKPATYPFDVERSWRLYQTLFAPIAGELAAARHLIFEPDGAMLRLPANLLATDRAGVDAYLAKAKRPDDDGFDFTGIEWLGKGRDISTAVSARAFRDVRQVSASRAANNYIGFGQNAVPAGEVQQAAAVRGLMDGAEGCSWSIAEWTRPIAADELYMASRTLGGGASNEIVTGEAFTDTAIRARGDLSQYRIMHFATHGLVTAPRPECPARPALMTSFGDQDSDGLLTFAEIYDLRIDADLVILSACDTAGKASVAATREAGVVTGGDFALDGLVRAFVGAGGRSVVASHWPVPDDYDATQRLISGLFTAPAGTSTAAALRAAQDELMRDADTSHPYYWSGFAIIGDGAAPVIPAGRDLKAD